MELIIGKYRKTKSIRAVPFKSVGGGGEGTEDFFRKGVVPNFEYFSPAAPKYF